MFLARRFPPTTKKAQIGHTMGTIPVSRPYLRWSGSGHLPVAGSRVKSALTQVNALGGYAMGDRTGFLRSDLTCVN